MSNTFFTNLEKHWADNLPFVAYRKPKETIIRALLQHKDTVHLCQNFNETGFVFAPFSSTENSYLIKSDVELETRSIPSVGDMSSFKLKATSDRDLHIQLIENALDVIEKKSLQKVVLARSIDATYEQSPIDVFKGLLKAYSSAFCYCWFHPKVGLWVGATPELLVKVSNGAFETMALAGTQKYHDGAITWGEKEKVEQNLVTQYIQKQLKTLDLNFSVGAAETVKAGNLAHLKSVIQGNLGKTSLVDLVSCLHPTPAVCGLPKKEAFDFIHKNESLNRQFYSGYLGEINKENRTHLFVNLRCMQLLKNEAILYVGGGITAQSNPELEWEETCAKSETIASIFK